MSFESFYGGRIGASFVIKKYFDGINIPDPPYKAKMYAYQNIDNNKYYLVKKKENVTAESTDYNKDYDFVERTAWNYTSYDWDRVVLDGRTTSLNVVDVDNSSHTGTKSIEQAYAEGMVQCFEQGGDSTDEVNYGEYVIIDTIAGLNRKNDPDNGKVFRRGINYSEGDLHGAEYIGQIVGPQGETPKVDMNSFNYIVSQAEGHASTGSYNMTDGMVPGKDSLGNYHDEIRYAYYNMRDVDGNIQQILIGFEFPYLVVEFTGQSRSPYDASGNLLPADFELIEPIKSPEHPFYDKWKINIPKGIKGDSLDTLEAYPTYSKSGVTIYNSIGTSTGRTTGSEIAIKLNGDAIKVNNNTFFPLINSGDYIKIEDGKDYHFRYKETKFDNKQNGVSEYVDAGLIVYISDIKIDTEDTQRVQVKYSNEDEYLSIGDPLNYIIDTYVVPLDTQDPNLQDIAGHLLVYYSDPQKRTGPISDRTINGRQGWVDIGDIGYIADAPMVIGKYNSWSELVNEDAPEEIMHDSAYKGWGAIYIDNSGTQCLAYYDYRVGQEKWVQGTPLGNSISLGQLTDVSFDNLQNGQVLRYNGTSWINGEAKDEKVKQSPDTTDANYEILFSGSANNAESTEGAKKDIGLKYNPSKKSVMEGSSTLASGNHSHAEGNSTCAIGTGSHAEGNSTCATGFYSHAEGSSTTAFGQSSHAEGQLTLANSYTSHAEGQYTTASNQSAHAEGNETLASNVFTHAEGDSTTASGQGAHAEGLSSWARGHRGHAEGFHTTAYENESHSEGELTISVGMASHAEGYQTSANGYGSHTEGYSTSQGYIRTNGQGAHAEGYSETRPIIANGNGSHAEGSATTANGDASHAEGRYTNAGNNGSHAEGYSTCALGFYSHAEGCQTYVTGHYSHAEGNGTSAIGRNSHVEGDQTYAVNDYSHAEGYNTCATGNCSHAEGNHTRTIGRNSHAEGAYTCAIGEASHAEGFRTTALGNYSHAEGYLTCAVGDDSHAEGFHTIAINEDSHAEGSYTIASGSSSHAEGYETCAMHNNQHVQGEYNDNKSETLFEIGNGTESTRSNAFEVYNNGKFSQDNGITQFKFTQDNNGDKGYIDENDEFHRLVGVEQTPTDIDANYEILFSASPNNDSEVNGIVRKNTGLRYNPSKQSFMEGYQTIASGMHSHAEGQQTCAVDDYSHTEGYQTLASGLSSHAEGSFTCAVGDYSHTEGYQTLASGQGSHAEGFQTTACGDRSHTQGYQTSVINTIHVSEQNIVLVDPTELRYIEHYYNGNTYSYSLPYPEELEKYKNSYISIEYNFPYEGINNFNLVNDTNVSNISVTFATLTPYTDNFSLENLISNGSKTFNIGHLDISYDYSGESARQYCRGDIGVNISFNSSSYTIIVELFMKAYGPPLSYPSFGDPAFRGDINPYISIYTPDFDMIDPNTAVKTAYASAEGFMTTASQGYSHVMGYKGETNSEKITTKGLSYFAIGGNRSNLGTIKGVHMNGSMPAGEFPYTYTDDSSNNVLNIDNKGNIFTPGALSLAHGVINQSTDVITVELEDGAMYMLYANGIAVNNSGVPTTDVIQPAIIAISARYMPDGTGITSSDLATPSTAYSAGSTTSNPIRVECGFKQYIKNNKTYYHSEISISVTNATNRAVRWNLVKVCGSINDF